MPRTRSRHATRISRRSPTHESHDGINSNPRPRLKVQEICVGCIVWLPPKVESDKAIKCVRDGGCCDGKELDGAGYNHPVVVLRIRAATCWVAKITSQPPKSRTLSKRIPISQNYPPQDSPNSEPTPELYLEIAIMEKQSYIDLEHIFSIPISMLRSKSYKHDSHAFDTRLRQESYIQLMERFGIDITGEEWEDTCAVASRTADSGRRPRVTFRDPWSELRRETSLAPTNHNHRTPRRSPDRRSYSEPTPSTNPALPAPRHLQTQPTLATPTREWHPSNRATDRSILRELAVERTALLQHPSPVPLPSSPSPHDIFPAQSTWHHQYHTQTTSRPQRSNYQAALPSVERYDRSHWDARIRNTNTRINDLERGSGSEEDGEDCDGSLFVKLVVVFLGMGGLVWWYYGR